ncbi:MAG: PBP1A family penicillin-binding protein [Alphaproteobacteria bacterium]|nr:PBP1A family penicillin-binding protein [Alphaproteobacteria bacterium]
MLEEIKSQLTIKRMFIGAFSLAVLMAVLFFGWILYLMQGLPSASQLAHYEPPITSRIHAGDGHLVAEFANQHRIYVPSDELPQQLIEAFISAEDKSFFEHSGVDWMGMLRGTLGNLIRGRRMAGGSTITQQVVKNMLVGSDRSITRKVRELILAQRIEKLYTKQQILELYMNENYLGGSSWGVGAASLAYFGKSLGDLTLAESAMLAGLPQRPSEANPYNHPDAAVRRRNYVLDRMAANGYITKAAAEKAKAEPLKTVDRLDTDENAAAKYYVEQVRREILRLGQEKKLAGFGNEKEATKAFYEGGLSIRSTLDTRLQLIAQSALRAGLESYDKRHGWRGALANIKAGDDFEQALTDFAKAKDNRAKIAGAGEDWVLAVVRSASKGAVNLGLADGTKGSLASSDVDWAMKSKSGIKTGDVLLVSRNPTPDVSSQTIADYGVRKKVTANSPWYLRQIPLVEGAVVAMDPHTGRVLAMAGGYSFDRSQFNRVVQAMRQPGSSFKPIVYSAAMENGWTPSTRVLDAPYVDCSDQTQEKCYKPENYERNYYGLMPLRFGIEESRNTMTVRLATDMGLNKVSEIGERMGVYDHLPPYTAMALGAGETTPLRMVTAYSAFVNGGKQVKPILLDRIQNRYGKTVYKTDDRACDGCEANWQPGLQPPVLADPRKQLLDPVTAYQMVSMLEGVVQRGTGQGLKVVGKPLGAKTGTTNDYTDAWMMGFSPNLALGVWVGYDQPRTLGSGETGSKDAGPIFRDFMMEALKNLPTEDFRIPQGVRLVEVDHDTGCLPGSETRLIILEAFKPGTEPTERCKVGGGSGEYTIDLSNVSAGDEAYTPPPPGGEVASAQGVSQPVPGQPATPPKPSDDQLTLKSPIF